MTWVRQCAVANDVCILLFEEVVDSKLLTCLSVILLLVIGVGSTQCHSEKIVVFHIVIALHFSIFHPISRLFR